MGQPHIGEIILVGFNFAPVGWASCQGQLLPISEYETLFTLIGTTYGGDGVSTFAVPDLRGRVALGQGQGPGLSFYPLGDRSGVTDVTLTTSYLPQHTHPTDFSTFSVATRSRSTAGNQRTPVANVPALEAAGVTMTYSDQAPDALMRSQSTTLIGDPATMTLANSGGNQPHSNMQPSLALHYCICLFGVFPAQN